MGSSKVETRTAWLFNERLGRMTRHEFIGARPGKYIQFVDRAPIKDEDCFHFIFRCEESGDERVWGVE